MNKQELIDAVAKETTLQKIVARDAVESMLKQIVIALARGERVSLRHFGTFDVTALKSDTEQKSKVPVFMPGNAMLKTVPGCRVMSGSITDDEIVEEIQRFYADTGNSRDHTLEGLEKIYAEVDAMITTMKEGDE